MLAQSDYRRAEKQERLDKVKEAMRRSLMNISVYL